MNDYDVTADGRMVWYAASVHVFGIATFGRRKDREAWCAAHDGWPLAPSQVDPDVRDSLGVLR